MAADTLKSKTISSLVWKLSERGGSSLVSLVIQIVLARLLAPEQFGMLAIILVFVNLGNVFVQSGLNTALVQAREVSGKDYSTVFWMCCSIALIFYIALYIFAPSIALFYHSEEITWPLRTLGLVLFVNAYNSVQVAKATRELEFKKIFFSTIVAALVSGLIGVISAICGAGLWALVIQQVINQTANCVVLAFQIAWRPRFTIDVRRAKVFFGFSWKLLASGLLGVGYQSLSDLIIGKQFSTANLGLVSQGKKYPQAIGSMLDGAIQPVMLSVISRVQDNADYVKRLTRRALKTSSFLIVPSMTMLAVVAEPLTRTLLGEQWLETVPFMQMYCFVYALLPMHTANLQTLNGLGRSDLFLKLEILKEACGVTILLFSVVVTQNVYFVVASYMVVGAICTFVNAWPNRRIIRYSYAEQVRDILPAFLLTAISVLATLPLGFVNLPDVVAILARCFVMVSVYLGFAKLLKVEAFSYLISTGMDLLSDRSRS
ncbi:lipopolysaccharide biosynthesis protein [Eggerthella timonensis]|uniref:lipopolysaccharide biosynthesis protein n=1 Tax=Eggerthella timonensis TaxID=1871008 RepID=UPI000C772F66|nr:lipopolysaccharide biosynthesis protein [Eggerthella timonensis]